MKKLLYATVSLALLSSLGIFAAAPKTTAESTDVNIRADCTKCMELIDAGKIGGGRYNISCKCPDANEPGFTFSQKKGLPKKLFTPPITLNKNTAVSINFDLPRNGKQAGFSYKPVKGTYAKKMIYVLIEGRPDEIKFYVSFVKPAKKVIWTEVVSVGAKADRKDAQGQASIAPNGSFIIPKGIFGDVEYPFNPDRIL